MADEIDLRKDRAAPRWLLDLLRFLPLKSQFILFNNIRDRYAFPGPNSRYTALPLMNYLAECLRAQGYQRFVRFNRIEGFAPVTPLGGNSGEQEAFFQEKFGFKLVDGSFRTSLEKSLDIVERLANFKEEFVAVFLDYASRNAVRTDSLTEKEHEYFSRALILSHTVLPHTTEQSREARFNSIFWICDRENDLPGWFALDNPRMRSISIPKPDHVVRGAVIEALVHSFPEYGATPPEEQREHTEAFTDQTEGMFLTDVLAIVQLSRREQLPFSQVEEAVRRFKLGVTEDPWKKLDRRKIQQGESIIGQRVKGQKPAVTKALDIIKRAVTGLSGSQAAKNTGRPRGVMFLAGPTGVGKTELAKTLTELLFGDERAYIRFDMSEFSAEHADQRLLGAPPGYVGYDAGGELTNKIKERPFSIVLFDEIEKAHPRILDKFLQLLDDGVLTSGRGERVYFSESVVIFTSNLGIYKTDREGNRILNVTPGDPYETVERKVRDEISAYFKLQLNRPEILNRFGENIVVFDFIRPEIANQIFEKMLANILSRVMDRQQITIILPDAVKEELKNRCIADLTNGGRGIGNQLEAWLINPLSRALFHSEFGPGQTCAIESLEPIDGVPTARLA